jgi:hypothetical protein
MKEQKTQNHLITQIAVKDKNGKVIGYVEVVKYAGLLSKAHTEGLKRIETELIQIPAKENSMTAIARAVIETSKGVFTGIGDANPENVNTKIIPHLIRMAETRAKARALRDAVNIGVVALEELGSNLEDEVIYQGQIILIEDKDNVSEDKSSNKETSSEPLITDSQLRYLFRILAQKGIQGDAAREHLCRELGVKDLKKATKSKASNLINALIKKQTEHGGNENDKYYSARRFQPTA